MDGCDERALPVDLLEFLLAAPAVLAAQRLVADLLHTAAVEVRRLTGAERIEVFTLDNTGRTLLCTLCDPADLVSHEPVPLYDGPRWNSGHTAAYAAVTGRLVTVPDVYQFTGFDFTTLYAHDRSNRTRTRSLLAFPLRNHDSVTIGVVQACNLQGDAAEPGAILSAWKARAVETFAKMVAVALTNLWLTEEKQHLIRRLARQNTTLEAENARLRNIAEHGVVGGDEVVGGSPAMAEVYRLVGRTLDSKVSVLLLGETGTGKDVLANAIHRSGNRSAAPFVVQNCAALPEPLLESELFGHRRGAFTGATDNKQGLFQAADKGTLFLDEIGDMPLGLQAKILRVLQDGEVRAVGDTKGRVVDVRIIAATHQDLREKVRTGSFREDLYYRLCVFPVTVPPLRDRRADILPLADYFLARAARVDRREKPRLSAAAAELLEAHPYPGNVRELRNIMERAMLLVDAAGFIEPIHLPPDLLQSQSAASSGLRGEMVPLPPDAGSLKSILSRYEAVVLSALLDDNGWNQTATARRLGISRRSLVEKMQRYSLRRAATPGR